MNSKSDFLGDVLKAIQNILLCFIITMSFLISFAFAKDEKAAVQYNPPVFQNKGMQLVFDKLKKACTESHTRAQKMCLQEFSPALRGTTEVITPLITALSAVGSMSDVCSGFAKVSRIVQTGLATYQAECGYFQGRCDSACAKLLIFESDMNKEFPSCTGVEKNYVYDDVPIKFESQEQCGADMETLRVDIKQNRKAVASVAYAIDTCAEYSNNVIMAGTNLIAMVISKKQAQSCKDESTVAGIDCTKSNNKQMAECICLSNPRSPGCSAGSLLGDLNQGKLQNSAFNGITGTEDAPLPEGSTLPQGGFDSPIGGGSGSGVSTPGAGSPPGVPGGGGMGGSSGGSAGTGSGSRYKVMPIGEEGGGGGGGGSRGSSSRSSRDSSLPYDSKYASYLPGGAKDPLRNPASVDANIKSEITGVGGKSNWDKVRERYNDNRYKMLRD